MMIKLVVLRLPGKVRAFECIMRIKQAGERQGRLVIARTGETPTAALRAVVAQARAERRHRNATAKAWLAECERPANVCKNCGEPSALHMVGFCLPGLV